MKQTRKASPILSGLLSALIPGLGQVSLRKAYRGIAILLSFLAVLGTVAYYGKPAWYFAPAGIWLWNIWDAISLAGGKARSILIPLLFGLVAAYGIGWQMVGIDFSKASTERAFIILKPMLHPDVIEARQESNSMWTPISVPCFADQTPPPATRTDNGMSASAAPDCGGPSAALTVSVSGLWPNTDTIISWRTAIGDTKALGLHEAAPLVVRTDANGSLTTTIHVPSTVMVAQSDTSLMLQHQIYFTQHRPLGGYEISTNGKYVLKGML